MSAAGVDQLLGALSEAAELGAGRVPDDELEQVRRIAARASERRALSSERLHSWGSGTGCSPPWNSKSNCPSHESMSSWLGQDSAARGFIPSGIS